MEEVRRRLAYRIGDKMPRALKILYYIVLWLTLIYLLYRLIQWLLCSIQKIGAFVFDPKNYWSVILCLFILLVGAILIAQFFSPIKPVDKFVEWIEQQFNGIKSWVSGTIERIK